MKKLTKYYCYSILILGLVLSLSVSAQKSKKEEAEEAEKHLLDTLSMSGLKFRSVGPALTSGRISDFAINPEKPTEYYVATSSGGVWKTVNSGTTYEPIFDGQASYSIGVITLDPNNSSVVWVGTGENNNQGSVAYGDGVYKSVNGGKNWENMGLKTSEHIGSIVIDPRNSNVVYVAAIGPLWNEGGERGLYKTTDGGENWENILEISEHTGINEVHMDPRNPDILYATAFQRRRHVFTYLGGGPESAIYKSVDGGENWEKIHTGIPSGDLGRIGLTISPANPDIIYAIIEAQGNKSGVYRSTNQGASWEKRGSYSTSGNYYQEIVADPQNPDKLFAMDTWLHHSVDGGKTFSRSGENTKHVDNHCIWINPENTDHWLVGCDGGIYETWDAAKTWSFKPNLPVTQFYKVAIDDSKPFYYIYGGTQDNFSLGGPSRTITAHGIMNSDWFITHGGDGFESQIDPFNPDIVYAQSQYGVLVRYDRKSGEELGIQPKPMKGEKAYRWNWDAPLIASPHKEGRIYFAANKLFKSEDRGNSWEAISEDLTQQIDRNTLKVMGRVWGIDAIAKNRSTSPYGTIVALSESPIDPDLLYVGTDDGLIQMTEDGGTNWRTIDNIPGAPERSYVNSLYASQHDENVVYALFNHHKYGDFKPYVFKSTDKGNSWTSISANLPERGSTYAIEEDHEKAGLLFIGTEFGVFFTADGGQYWKQMKSGVPTIAVRDLAIHKENNDLILGTFGRGFYVLDDYSVLRELTDWSGGEEDQLFAVREALSYEYSMPLGLPGKSFQGDSYYSGDNLGSVAMFTYYVGTDIQSLEKQRQKAESKALKAEQEVAYPAYDALVAETRENDPQLVFTIRDGANNVIRKLTKSPAKGIQRITWDLRYAPKNPISLNASSFYNPFAGKREGTLVLPGTYTVSLAKVIRGEVSEIGEPVSFEVKSLNNTTLPAEDRMEKVAFQREVTELYRTYQGAQRTVSDIRNQLKHIRQAIVVAETPITDLLQDVDEVEDKLYEIGLSLSGDRVKATLDIDQVPPIGSRIGGLMYEQYYSTASPTETHREVYNIANESFKPVLEELAKVTDELMPSLQKKLEAVGAPYTPGRRVEYGNE